MKKIKITHYPSSINIMVYRPSFIFADIYTKCSKYSNGLFPHIINDFGQV